MIRDQGLRAKEILSNALKKFRDYYPNSRFSLKDGNWHASNIRQMLADLDSDKKTSCTSLEDFEEALNRGITGEFDEKMTPAISILTFPVIKKWILRHKGETQKVTTGPQFEDYEVGHCDPKKTELYSWLWQTSIGYGDWKKKFSDEMKAHGLIVISEDPDPTRFEKQKSILEK